MEQQFLNILPNSNSVIKQMTRHLFANHYQLIETKLEVTFSLSIDILDDVLLSMLPIHLLKAGGKLTAHCYSRPCPDQNISL